MLRKAGLSEEADAENYLGGSSKKVAHPLMLRAIAAAKRKNDRISREAQMRSDRS